MDILNNREISILLWSFLFLTWCIAHPEIRKSLLNLIKCIFVKPIATAISLMAFYVVGLVWLLHQLGLWGTDQLKATLVWSVSIALISLFRIHKTKEYKKYLHDSLRDVFRLTIFLEFIVDYYSFGLIFELIFIPVMALIAGVLAVSETDKKYQSVERLLNRALSLIGLFIIGYSAYMLYYDSSSFLSLSTWKDFYTPPLLSLGFMPFILLAMTYVRYEQASIRLNFLIKESDLRSYAKKAALKKFHVNVEGFERWLNTLPFYQINSKQDIDHSILEMEATIHRERNPQPVPISEGWSPHEAKRFLEEVGLPLGHYNSIGGGEWHASSSYLEIGKDVLPNNVAFYISGSATVAKSLKLILNVNYLDNEKESLDVFLHVAMQLFKKALGEEMPISLKKAILSGHQQKVRVKDKTICVTKHTWVRRIDGYEIKLLVEV